MLRITQQFVSLKDGLVTLCMKNQDDNPISADGGPNQEQPPSLAAREYNYRVRYPNEYIADQGLKVIKFERDYQQQLTYEFVRSFPLSISSMPVSFDASSLLKVTVSMSYIRYIVLKTPSKTGSKGQFNPNNQFNPSSQAETNAQSFTNLYRNKLPLGANDLLRSAQIT